jgi:hypothetical protein
VAGSQPCAPDTLGPYIFYIAYRTAPTMVVISSVTCMSYLERRSDTGWLRCRWAINVEKRAKWDAHKAVEGEQPQ